MRRPRFTIRRLMAVVAVVAVLSGGYVESVAMRSRATLYRKLARSHAEMEDVYRSIIAREGEQSPVDYYQRPGREGQRFTLRDMADYEAALRRKYEAADCFPWFPVEPDPPPSRARSGAVRPH